MKLDISTWSIVKTLLILISAWVLWQIRDILVLLFLVMILVAALRPTVDWFVARRIPRIAAVTSIMLIIIGGFLVLLSIIIPAIVEQLQFFIFNELPTLIERYSPFYESVTQGQKLLDDVLQQLQQLSGNIVDGVISLFGGLVSALTVLALTFYLLLEEDPLKRAGLELLPVNYRHQVANSLERIGEKLGAWLRGQFILSVIIGVITAVGMGLIGVPAPLAIGLVAGLLEILPIVGPLVAGIVMVAMAATSPDAALVKVTISLVFAVAVQFAENHFLVPNIMRQAIGLSPVVVIIALLIGGQLGGVTGAVIAVPVAAILQVAAEDWSKFKQVKPK